jgi:hypothetical protein
MQIDYHDDSYDDRPLADDRYEENDDLTTEVREILPGGLGLTHYLYLGSSKITRLPDEPAAPKDNPDDWRAAAHRTIDAETATRQLAHDLAQAENETATLAQIADDAKVTRHEEETAQQLRAAILLAGEGGWRSPFYTGSCSGVSEQERAYKLWRNARDEWTKTGDEKYLQALTDAVDFTVPPEAGAVYFTPPKAGVTKPKTKKLSIVQIVVAVLAAYILVVTLLMTFW